MELFTLKEAILDIIYPPNLECCICGMRRDDIDKYGVCPECTEGLPFIVPPVCNKCGKPVLVKGEVCPDCLSSMHSFQQAMSVFEYRPVIQKLIHRYKYKGEVFLGRPMVYWMAEALKRKAWAFDLVIPVPLHRKRKRMRGFNQAAVLARGIGREMGSKVSERSLIRVKDTPTQATMSKGQRVKNLQDAFSVKYPKDIKGKTLLLIDDVYTTGNTADQCTRALLGAGAKKVYILTLATGRNM